MRDGHVHSQYCPHGSNDKMEQYVEKAIGVGLKEISFTEHLFLPDNFEDPSPLKDSCIDKAHIMDYIEEIEYLKEKYKGRIKINAGIEADYLEGYEKEVKANLDEYGKYFDDTILSIHIIKVNGKHRLLDFSPEDFKDMIEELGSLEAVYNRYYETVKLMIESDLGEYKPRRLGHLNRVREFNKLFPYDYKDNKLLMEIVQLIKEEGYELDYNISGKRKENCGEAYVDGPLLDLVRKYDIPLVPGSDSHTAGGIGSTLLYI